MKYRNSEAEQADQAAQATQKMFDLPALKLARDFGVAWADWLEAKWQDTPVDCQDYPVDLSTLLDSFFMPSMIEVGNRPEFRAATPQTYAWATEFLHHFWVHGDGFLVWIRRLEQDTSWEILHRGVKVAGARR